MPSWGWSLCLDNLIYLNFCLAGGRWVGRKCTVEEASLKEKDKVGCREKWRWKDRDSKKDRERKGIQYPSLLPWSTFE